MTALKVKDPFTSPKYQQRRPMCEMTENPAAAVIFVAVEWYKVKGKREGQRGRERKIQRCYCTRKEK